MRRPGSRASLPGTGAASLFAAILNRLPSDLFSTTPRSAGSSLPSLKAGRIVRPYAVMCKAATALRFVRHRRLLASPAVITRELALRQPETGNLLRRPTLVIPPRTGRPSAEEGSQAPRPARRIVNVHSVMRHAGTAELSPAQAKPNGQAHSITLSSVPVAYQAPLSQETCCLGAFHAPVTLPGS